MHGVEGLNGTVNQVGRICRYGGFVKRVGNKDCSHRFALVAVPHESHHHLHPSEICFSYKPHHILLLPV
jgi:hypothetical protein